MHRELRNYTGGTETPSPVHPRFRKRQNKQMMKLSTTIEQLLGPSIRILSEYTVRSSGSEVTTRRIYMSRNNEQAYFYFVKELILDDFLPDIIISFNREVDFYTHVIPEIQVFQQLQHLPFKEYYDNFFPKCVRAVKQTGPSFRNKGALLLENLWGYRHVTNLRLGLSILEISKAVDTLARMHAYPMAMNLKSPRRFKSRVLPYLDDIRYIEISQTSLVDVKQTINAIKLGLFSNMNLNYFQVNLLKTALANSMVDCWYTKPTFNKKWFTICHGNYYAGNLLMTYDRSSSFADSVKTLALRGVEYNSALRELAIFFFTSINIQSLRGALHIYLEQYHKTVLKTLKECGVETTTYESYPMFLENFRSDLNSALIDILLILLNHFKRDVNKGTVIEDEKVVLRNYIKRVEAIIEIMFSRGLILSHIYHRAV